MAKVSMPQDNPVATFDIEKGDPSVAIGFYAKVLNAIGMQEDLLLVARDDVYGRLLQDTELERKYRK